ncbi:MAG: hypothetical protein KGY50_01350 [Candidatus Thermoplasmatota archaeon]|nr:hypothetical protein [Candidatus Thermoplasmatota archaeon]
MNLSLFLTGIILMSIGILFGFATFGFGFICSWPVVLIGFIMFILGIVSPSSASYKQPDSYTYNPYNTQQTKRICPNCGKTMPLQSKHCPHCGKENKYS